MEVFQLPTTVDASGHLHLDIPTQLAPGTVNIVVVLNPLGSDRTQKSDYDFSDLAGKLVWEGDALVPQGGSHSFKSQKSKVLRNRLFRVFKWFLYFRRGVLAMQKVLRDEW